MPHDQEHQSVLGRLGPMSGIPQFNYPAFDVAAVTLRAAGYEVQSPAELDNAETRAKALSSPDGSPGSGSHDGETWGDFLARDVKLIADSGIHEIRVLPGWSRSRGARLETFIARALCGIPIRTVSGRKVRFWRLIVAWATGR